MSPAIFSRKPGCISFFGVIVLVHTLAGLAIGALLGFLLRSIWNWPEAPAIFAVCGCVGQACRALVAWVGRPSPQTHAYQLRINTPAVVASALFAFAAVLTLLQFPATILVPAASYGLVRVVLNWQSRQGGSISSASLRFAARGGEILTLLAAIMKV